MALPFKDSRRALLIGTGGGNDIASAVIPAQQLQRHGIETDIAGVLSPAAAHRCDGRIESVVNDITSGRIERWIPFSTPAPISFVDAVLPGAIAQAGLRIPRIYDLSIRYGTEALLEGVETLVRERGYDLVIAVDVGGDILARGQSDPTVLSPLMDHAILWMCSHLSVPTALVEFGLGTDGELRPEGMREIVEELRSTGAMLAETRIAAGNPEIIAFRTVFDELRKTRAGHTGVMTLRTLDTPTPDEDIITTYRYRSRIRDKSWHTPYEVVLPHEHFGAMYWLDAKKVAAARRETAHPFTDPLAQYLRTKMENPSWKTELDLYPLRSGDGWRSPAVGDTLWLLMPTLRMPGQQRSEVIAAGLEALRDGYADAGLFFCEDVPRAGVGPVVDLGPVTLVGNSRDVLARIAPDIEKRLSASTQDTPPQLI